jgi:hypothetical protein
MKGTELTKKVDESFTTSNQDHLLNVLKAMLNAVPIVGGSLASLLSDYIPKAREVRLKDFLADFAQELSEVSEKVDTTNIESERFSEVFAKTLKSVAETHSKEKRDVFKSFLISRP